MKKLKKKEKKKRLSEGGFEEVNETKP